MALGKRKRKNSKQSSTNVIRFFEEKLAHIGSEILELVYGFKFLNLNLKVLCTRCRPLPFYYSTV